MNELVQITYEFLVQSVQKMFGISVILLNNPIASE
jgi:hypothetical protein